MLPAGCLMAAAEAGTKLYWNGWGTPAEAAQPPQSPLFLLGTLADSPPRVELAWTPPLSGTPEGYTVYRQVDGGAFARLNAALLTQTTFTDNALVAGTLTYKVTASANGQEGAASNSISLVYAPPPPPPAPSLEAPQALQASRTQTVAIRGAVAYLFDEGSGQTAGDASGFGHTGQLGSKPIVDSNEPTWTTGIAGGALLFDGSNDRVMVPDAADLHFAASFTVEAGCGGRASTTRTASPAKGLGRRNFWMLFDSTNAIDFRWQTSSGKTTARRPSRALRIWAGTTSLAVYDQTAGQNRIYYDGVLVQRPRTRNADDQLRPALRRLQDTIDYVKSFFHGKIDLRACRRLRSMRIISSLEPPSTARRSLPSSSLGNRRDRARRPAIMSTACRSTAPSPASTRRS